MSKATLELKQGSAIDAALWTKENLDKIEDGEAYPDGTIRFGKDLTLKDGFYRAVTPQDAAVSMGHSKARRYAKNLDAFGYKDWRLAGRNEGQALYRAADKGQLKGTFNNRAHYWLANHYFFDALVQKFNDGDQYYDSADIKHKVRCVRRFRI